MVALRSSVSTVSVVLPPEVKVSENSAMSLTLIESTSRRLNVRVRSVLSLASVRLVTLAAVSLAAHQLLADLLHDVLRGSHEEAVVHRGSSAADGLHGLHGVLKILVAEILNVLTHERAEGRLYVLADLRGDVLTH